MSVIVIGMDMPKSCRECCLEALGYFCMPIESRNKDIDVWLRTQYWRDIGERPDWCPIRPLPEKHGRLIDASELETVAKGRLGVINIGHIDEVRTIVEAEGE